MQDPKTTGSARRWALAWAACLPACACCANAGATTRGAPGRLVASSQRGWPQWRGPRRDGVSDETGLLASWPEGGPALLWAVSGLGRGFASPIVTGGTIYVAGDVKDRLTIFALGLDGKPKWQADNGRAWKGSYPGARASACYSGGRLYHMNAHGRAACLDANSGKELWAVDVLQRFGARNIPWAISECLLLDGPRVIVTPGGRNALMAALDARTGRTVWATPPLAGEAANYASPILVDHAGRRVIVTCGSRHTFAVDAADGRLLWTFAHGITRAAVMTTPVFWRDSVFVTNSSQKEHAFYRLRIDPAGGAVEKLWSLRLKNNSGTMLFAEGRIYGASLRDPKGWSRVEPESGKIDCMEKAVEPGSAVWADGRLYCLSDRAEALLLKPAPARLEVAGRFRLVARGKNAFAHPVVCDGRLYLRYEETLYCHDVRRPDTEAGETQALPRPRGR